MNETPSVTPHAPPAHDLMAPAAEPGTTAAQERVRQLLRTPCRCWPCEPMYEQRVMRSDPNFADLVPISGREAFEEMEERNRLALEASADKHRHLPRVMDLPEDIDLEELRELLAHGAFHPTCPQYRQVVALLADGSFESAVALSRIGHFDRAEAARAARPKKRSRKPSKPRRVKPVCSLLAPADLVITQEQIEADRAHRARLAQPDRVAEAREKAQQQFSEQLAAAMLGTDVSEADEI